MTVLYIIIALLLVVAAALLTMFLAGRKREAAIQNTLAQTQDALSQTQAQNTQEIQLKNERITELLVAEAQTKAQIQKLAEQQQRDKEELEKLQASFRLEFRNLANEILEEKSTQFKATNKEAINVLLTPLKDDISKFRDRVDKIYSDENLERGVLKNEIKTLHELNLRITQETSNLTSALRGNSKIQGDWGEMILKTTLESFNLILDTHFTIQENLKDNQGNNLRPDVILNLPDSKRVVIDSKVSLTAFVNYMSEDDSAKREGFLRDHLQSVRQHVNDLGSKSYHDKLAESPDFVIMFIPNEPAYMTALQHDSSIWSDAYNKRVIISSPTNLFTIIKIVDDLWKRDTQSRNTLEIAEEGAKMYDKFVGFAETLLSLGKNIKSTSDSYDKAMNQLQDGTGSLVTRSEKLLKLGVKASKTLPRQISSLADNFDPDVEDAPEEIEQTKPIALSE